MTAALRDYHVKFLREERIEQIALEWRQAAGNQNYAHFDVIDFINRILRTKLKKGHLIVSFFDMAPGSDPAFVRFNPPTLNIDRETWEDAKLGEPLARFIIAHEAGHLILHDHDAKAFSSDPGEQIKFARNEYSAEWQANKFAEYFLLPTHIVAAYDDVEEIVQSCGVTRQTAKDRVTAVRAAKARSSIKYDGEACLKCGGFKLVRYGTSLKCSTCETLSGENIGSSREKTIYIDLLR